MAKAVRYFIEAQEGQALREELIAGYKATAEEASVMAEEWLALGQEPWENHVPDYEDEEREHDV